MGLVGLPWLKLTPFADAGMCNIWRGADGGDYLLVSGLWSLCGRVDGRSVSKPCGWRCVCALLWPESMRMTSPGGWGGAQTSLLRVKQRKQTDPYIAAMGTVTFHAVWLQAHDHMRMCSDLFS